MDPFYCMIHIFLKGTMHNFYHAQQRTYSIEPEFGEGCIIELK